jgi:hypothetical protein
MPLPEGFVIDESEGLPSGFVIDEGERQDVGGVSDERIPREVPAGAKIETRLQPDYSVSTTPTGMGDPGYSVAAGERAAGLPELKNPKAIATALLEADPAERSQMLKSMGVEVKPWQGLDFATVNGKEYVINKPGMSMADVLPFATDLALSIPGALAGSAVKPLITKPIKTALKKGMAVAGTELAVASGREGLDVLAGGNFDKIEVAFAPLMAGGAEIAAPVLRSLARRLNPKAAIDFKKAKTLEEFVLDKKGNIDLERLNAAKEIARESAEAGTLPAEASEFLAQFVREASLRDPSKAAEIELINMAKTDQAKSGLMRSFSEISGLDLEDAIPAFTGEVKDALDTKIAQGKIGYKAIYKKALEGAPPIETDTLAKASDSWLANSTKDVRSKYNKILEDLRPDNWEQLQAKYRSDLADWERGTGSLMPKQGPRPLPPTSEIAAEKLQSVAIAVGDLMDKGESYVKAGKDIKNALKARLRNKLGPDWAKADLAYQEFQEYLKKIPGTFESGVTKGAETTYGQTIKLLFEPPAGQERFALKAMERLHKSNPDAAKNLIGARFKAQLDDLGADAKPSQILDKVFGSTPSEKKMFNNMMDIAAEPKTVINVGKLKNMLEVGKRLEDVSEDEAIRRLVTGKFDPDVAHYVYVRLAVSRAIKDKIDTTMADSWFQAATSPEFAKEWGELLNSRRYMNAIAKDEGKQRDLAEWLRTTDTFEAMLPRLASIATSKRATQSEDERETE